MEEHASDMASKACHQSPNRPNPQLTYFAVRLSNQTLGTTVDCTLVLDGHHSNTALLRQSHAPWLDLY